MIFIVSGGCPRCLFLALIAGSLTQSFPQGQPRHRQGNKTLIVGEKEHPPTPSPLCASAIAGTPALFWKPPITYLAFECCSWEGVQSVLDQSVICHMCLENGGESNGNGGSLSLGIQSGFCLSNPSFVSEKLVSRAIFKPNQTLLPCHLFSVLWQRKGQNILWRAAS